MEIATIKGDEVLLIYHPADESAEVGLQYKITELTEAHDGLVVQIISNDSLEYIGLQQEIIQRVLEERLAETIHHLDREYGLGQMRSLKIATAKIRKRIRAGNWESWDGWIPTRNVAIESVQAEELIGHVIPQTRFAMPFCAYNGTNIDLDGESLNMVNVITGVKGSGKSHTAKHFVLQLSQNRVPVIVFDVNGEYIQMPGAQVMRWGENFRPALDEMGHPMLQQMIRDVRPLPENSEAVFASRLPQIWRDRREYCRQRNQPFSIDITTLRNVTWGGGNYVQEAIDSRLETIQGMGFFHEYQGNQAQPLNLAGMYALAAGDTKNVGQPIIFDMRSLGSSSQRALVSAMNNVIKTICRDEASATGNGRFPFVFYEEAHFYISEDVIIDIITRGRHIGMGAFFVTNTPQELPRTVFRQLDNLFLLSLTHNDDIKNVSNSSFTDEETIRSFATRMPRHHALIIGNITRRYPLVVKVSPLPEHVPASGQTRSTWDRFGSKD
ncbi:MAG: DUF87 domain-containing protein [bacterium]|nr:DUF87 domain-containing protein [bacterium]